MHTLAIPAVLVFSLVGVICYQTLESCHLFVLLLVLSIYLLIPTYVPNPLDSALFIMTPPGHPFSLADDIQLIYMYP